MYVHTRAHTTRARARHVKVLATALDPRTFDLYGVPPAEHNAVWAMVVDAVADIIREERAAPRTSAAASTAAAAAAPPGGSTLPMGTASSARGADERFQQSAGFFSRARQRAQPAVAVAAAQPERPADRAYARSLAEREVREFRELAAKGVLPFFKECEGGGRVPANPLAWYESHHALFPAVGKLARRVLCIPATSAPSERLFSVAGQVLTAKRSRLKGAHVAVLVWLRAAWAFFESRGAAQK